MPYDREKHLLQMKEWRHAHKGYMKAWRAANRDKVREHKNRCNSDPTPLTRAGKRLLQVKRRANHPQQAVVAWADAHAIAEAYVLASLLTEKTGVLWVVDHIVPLKSKLVSGLHVHTNLQIITEEENLKKYNVSWPDKG